MKKTSKEIRNEFIQFFADRGHTFVPSCPLLPAEDPTLLFTNAGMNQFKDIFLAKETRDYTRAANSQKCIRAGGKHNDLEDVGHDCYHHTFFEMLGNWSFGDYFKEDAIKWAWELLTEVWNLPKDRLHATVFGGDKADGLDADTEAEQIWRDMTDIDPTHIHHGNKKDNFWEMGATGPCGPCSEIHIDLTEDGSGGNLVNAGNADVVELWNLVFMQYNRDESGKLSPLPAQHVDTGMGFERINFALAGKRSVYATDLFIPLIEKIEALTDHRYGANSGLEDRFDVTSEEDLGDVACRVVADHIRALTFAISDGIIPSNEGRGYVLRRILRRAARYGREYLNIEKPFLAGLVPTVVELMGEAFGEIAQQANYVQELIAAEEEAFGKTLDRGIDLFAKQADQLKKAGKSELPGDVAFDLYATFGFPVDLTQVMAGELDMTVDIPGYEKAMSQHREISGAGGTFKAAEQIEGLPASDDSAKFSRQPIEGTVLGWVADEKFISDGALDADAEAAIVLDKTNFYAEQGGQVGDTGRFDLPGGSFVVTDTVVAGATVLHVGRVEAGKITCGDTVTAMVDRSRLDTMRNHTGTHVLNWALRQVLGEHINQAGSVVGPDRLRFDFSHNQAVTADQLSEIERLCNERILADEPVTATVMPLADAQKISGVRAVFGEKYPDPVRVISIGSDGTSKKTDQASAIEFCGGTHLSRSSQIGLFKITSEESIAKGIRRISAVTGQAAVELIQQTDQIVRSAAMNLKVAPAQLNERIEAMAAEIKQLRKSGPKAAAPQQELKAETITETPQGPVLVARMDNTDAPAMRALCDQQRQKGAAAMFIAGVNDSKVTLTAMVSQELVDSGKLKAGDWVKAIAPIVGGGGGGKPTLAQAGGKMPEKLNDALAAAAEFATKQLA